MTEPDPYQQKWINDIHRAVMECPTWRSNLDTRRAYSRAIANAFTEQRGRHETLLDMMRDYIAAADDFAAGKPIDIDNLRAKLDLIKAELRTAAKEAGRG